MTTQELTTFLHLSPEDRQYIIDHLDQNTDQLAFQLPRTAKSKFLLHQIQARKKIKHKLPTWYNHPALIMPPTLSLEQCSSEATARFKQSLIKGNRLLDLTGGMGIDTSYLSENFEQTFYFEQQEELVNLATYNFAALGKVDILCLHTDAISYLQAHDSLKADWIYLDPARRDEAQRKVFHLSDCTPDVAEHEQLLLLIAPHVLVKTSPVLDIDLTIKQLQSVSEVYCIGYENECKEVLYLLSTTEKTEVSQVPIHAVILHDNGTPVHQITFNRQSEQACEVDFSAPDTYLYEPHAAVLKSGALKSLTSIYPLKKIAPSSHLYTSNTLVEEFPGRIFTIKAVTKPDAKSILPHLQGATKANLTVRNFPATVSDLRKKLRLKEGGHHYLFASTLSDQQKVIIVTEKYAI